MTLNIKDYQYHLPNNRIALYPLEKRDQSKLLVFQKGQIRHTKFSNIVDLLPDNSFLFFNDTKVIPARLHFKKSTGADIEIFLLDPITPSPVVSETMAANGKCAWHCVIGNLKRWNDGLTLIRQHAGITLEATIIDRPSSVVEFRWDVPYSFAHVVDVMGETPLPPYLKRKAESGDKTSYQTVYSKYEGAVAAPTAGLHFTDEVLQSLAKKNIGRDFLTLHVSAGTFQPVKTEKADEHIMHKEQIVVNRQNIENLLREKFFVAVGTTSMRTLESVYWYGVKLLANGNAPFLISQNDPYTLPHNVSRHDALATVLNHMDISGGESLIGETSIFIKPGYKFRICEGLITNFHQPGSTLILLVAAFIGDFWKDVYSEALRNDYRFLSYGDSSLLVP